MGDSAHLTGGYLFLEAFLFTILIYCVAYMISNLRRFPESHCRTATSPADQDVGHGRPLHGAVTAKSEAWLAVDVLRVADVRAVVALVDGHVYSCSFRVRLHSEGKSRC